MSIEMFLKFVAVLMFSGFSIYTNIKAGENWLKLFTIVLFVVSLLYAGYLLIV